MFDSLPAEISTAIFGYLDPSTAKNFAVLSKQSNSTSKHTSSKANLLINYYGKGQVIYGAYSNFRSMLTGHLAKILIQRGAKFPRFLGQLIIRDVMIQS